MLREETYMQSAELFGTSVGVAQVMKTIPLISADTTQKRIYKEVREELDLHKIICKSIEMGSYRMLMRVVFKMKKKMGKRNIKELTIYKKAFDEINGIIKEKNNAAPSKVF
jgi:hypothetical protein